MHMKLKRTVLSTLLPLLSLSGCGNLGDIKEMRVNPLEWWSGPAEQVSRALEGATRYECDASKRFAVRYGTPANAVMVILPEREFRLDAVAAAAATPGVRYSNGRSTLNTKGDIVFMEEDGVMVFANCKRVS